MLRNSERVYCFTLKLQGQTHCGNIGMRVMLKSIMAVAPEPVLQRSNLQPLNWHPDYNLMTTPLSSTFLNYLISLRSTYSFSTVYYNLVLYDIFHSVDHIYISFIFLPLIIISLIMRKPTLNQYWPYLLFFLLLTTPLQQSVCCKLEMARTCTNIKALFLFHLLQ